MTGGGFLTVWRGSAGGANLVLAPVNIHEILDHCLNVAQAVLWCPYENKRSYDPSLPLVNGHRDLLIQAFINIIKNASEATELNSEITIKTSYSQGRRLTFAAVNGGSFAPVQVEVIDNGRGISEDCAIIFLILLFRARSGEVVLV